MLFRDIHRYGELQIDGPTERIGTAVCVCCRNETLHRTLVSASLHQKYVKGAKYVDDHYEVIQCQGCHLLSFRRVQYFSDDEFTGQVEDFFPKRVKNRYLQFGKFELPDHIYRIYEEVHSSICHSNEILAVIGIRALIEAACKDRQAKGKNLSEKIDDLRDRGLLNQHAVEILHGLRVMGNVAVHEIRSPGFKMLNLAMDVVEHLLRDIYVVGECAWKFSRK